MELVTDPPMLVLDEPTSGLSSTDALAVVKLLRSLADAGKTVVLTIHQPGLEALRQMDALAVVARDSSTAEIGTLVWYGPAHPEAARFFEPQGRSDDAEAVLRGLATRPVAEWRRAYGGSAIHRDWIERRQSPANDLASPAPRRGASLLDGVSQWWTLVRRSLAIKAADRWTTAVLLLQAPVIGLLVAGVFGARASAAADHATWVDSARAVATTTFLLALAAIWFGCSNAAREIVAERAILRRERMVGMSLTAYLASKLVVLAGLCGIQCGILLAIVGRGCGLEAPAGGTWWTLVLAALGTDAVGRGGRRRAAAGDPADGDPGRHPPATGGTSRPGHRARRRHALEMGVRGPARAGGRRPHHARASADSRASRRPEAGQRPGAGPHPRRGSG
ncbi:MAG: hypothetical protein EBX36_01905 [Planctomycetia bacterium]|nr:hypothetical protein [Planctomycetia bacterium]